MTAPPNYALRVLLVDDDEFMLDFACDLLKEMGVRAISTANDGRSALSAFDLASPKPDVILCDLQMPGKDGFQLMEALAERKYKGGVIVLSGQQDRVLHSAELMGQFHQLQVLGTLAKPADRATLQKAIGKLQTPPLR